MNWYLLQTKPNAHIIAYKNLTRQGFEVFMPLIATTTKKGGKFVNNTAPLFPSYLFIGTLLNKISWNSINATRGVSKALTLDGKYRPVDPNIVEGIKCRCDDFNVLQTIDKIKIGDRVKIEKGPFAEFICSVEKITNDKRAWILIDLLNQQTRVKVPMNFLSKAG